MNNTAAVLYNIQHTN